MSANNIYYFEGECEENFLKAFKANETIHHGVTRKVNLWEESKFNKVLRKLPSGRIANVYVIFDTDVTSQVDRFIENVNKLAIHSKKVILLPQHFNFEDEIAFSCDLSNASKLPLYIYKIKGLSDFKARVSNDRNLAKKLITKNFSIEKMWSRLDFKNSASFNQNNIYWGSKNVIAEK